MIARPADRIQSTVMVGLIALSGAVVGYGLHDAVEPSARECVVAVNTADRLLISMTNLLSAVRVRGDAVGREDYAKADADVVALLDENQPIADAYNDVAPKCTGATR